MKGEEGSNVHSLRSFHPLLCVIGLIRRPLTLTTIFAQEIRLDSAILVLLNGRLGP